MIVVKCQIYGWKLEYNVNISSATEARRLEMDIDKYRHDLDESTLMKVNASIATRKVMSVAGPPFRPAWVL